MSQYEVAYESRFLKDLRRYRGLRKQIQQHITQVLVDPYQGTERLGRGAGRLDLHGCRSVRVTRNFRILFVICEECRQVPECQFCFCKGLSDRTVVFLAVGPHEKAYSLREVAELYTFGNGES
jgi:mRNA-degrading endonuclease RelE of RelBE toxin-antitoxin system